MVICLLGHLPHFGSVNVTTVSTKRQMESGPMHGYLPPGTFAALSKCECNHSFHEKANHMEDICLLFSYSKAPSFLLIVFFLLKTSFLCRCPLSKKSLIILIAFAMKIKMSF